MMKDAVNCASSPRAFFILASHEQLQVLLAAATVDLAVSRMTEEAHVPVARMG
jgi:hypothetical protein